MHRFHVYLYKLSHLIHSWVFHAHSIRDILLVKISEEPNGLRSSHLSWITDVWGGKDGYQVAFPAPKAEGKDHKDQGNLLSC